MFKKSIEQENIFEEIKNGTGDLLINALAGTGKCLGLGTKVLMYDLSYKNVEDISIGDILMGDDGTPRNVLNIGKGNDFLYKVIINKTGEYFYCNGDHILTCLEHIIMDGSRNVTKIPIKKDISITDILNKNDLYNENDKKNIKGLYLYRSILDFNGSNIKNFYEYGNNFYENKNIKYEDILTSIENRYLILSGIIDKYFYPFKNIMVLDKKYSNSVKNKILIKLVRSLGITIYKKFNQYKIENFNIKKFSLKSEKFKFYFFDTYKNNIYKFNENKFNIIKKNKNDYYGFTLDGNGRFIIEDYIVTHNTTTIINSLEMIPKDKSVLMLAFNKHIAKELKEKLPKRDKLFVSTTHGLGWGAIRKKYKGAEIDNNKVYRVINSKIPRWNMEDIDNVDEYISNIKKMVDLCRLTLTLNRRFVTLLAKNHSINLTDEDSRRVLSVIEEMYNDTKTFDFVDMVYLPAIDKKMWLFPNDYVFVDECISGNNNLITDKGPIKFKNLHDKYVINKKSWMSQQDIPKALSYNFDDNKYEHKNITNIEYKGHKNVSRISFKNLTLYPTESHLFYSSDGWRECKDLRIGDLVKVNNNNIKTCELPNIIQTELLMIMYLCDYLNTKEKNILRFRFYVKKSDDKYLNLINNIIGFNIKSKINTYYDEYCTESYFYNTKILSKEYVISNLNNRQLAFLVMRQHYIDKDFGVGFYIKANNYDNALYIKSLFELSLVYKYNIKYFNGNYYLFPIDQHKFLKNISSFLTSDYSDIIPKEQIKNVIFNTYKKSVNSDNYMVIKNIKHNFKKTRVYDITVEDNHNYFVMGVKNFNLIGGPVWRKNRNNVGVLSHNCQDYNRSQQFILNKIIKKDTGRLISVGDENQNIYGFMGSDTNSFNWFRNRTNTKILPLTTSFRCSKKVIEFVQNIVPNIKYKHDAVEGSVRSGSVLEEAKTGDFILSRKNSPLIKLLYDLLDKNKNASIRGNDIGIQLSKQIKKYKNINALNSGLDNVLSEKRTQLLNLGVADVFNDPRYLSVEDNVNVIRFLMNRSNSISEIIDKISLIFTDNPDGIVLSTIHKSKGLEADNVFIIKPDKIKIPTKIPEMWEQEINLEYIAYTRAKVNLIFDNEWDDED